MKKVIFVSTLSLLTLMFSCSKDTVFGSDDLISETRNVGLFTKVSSEGIFEVIITQEPTPFLQITADDNVISHVRTTVVNNELRLYLDDAHNYRDITVQATISTTTLISVTNSGAGNMRITDFDTQSFSLDNLGAGSITIVGTTQNLQIDNEGSGDILCFDLLTNNCDVEIKGSGSVEINCSGSLDIDIKGSGNVFYKGNPAINTSISGSGSIINAN